MALTTTYQESGPVPQPYRRTAGRDSVAMFLPGRSARSAGIARVCLREALGTWNVPRSSADDLELIVSELVTNAVLHTTSPWILFRFRRCPGLVAVAVLDRGPRCGPVRPRECVDEEDLGGRGLVLVDQCAAMWGEQRAGRGTWTWAAVSTDGEGNGC